MKLTTRLATAVGAALLAGALAAPAAVQAAGAPVRAITRVTGDLYRFQNDQHVTAFLVTPAGVVVSDPISLDAANWLRAELARRFNGAQVVAVLYSHHHWDHASGAAAFPGARLIGRVEMTDALKGPLAGTPLADVRPPTETYATPVHRVVVGGRTVEMHHVPGVHAPDMSLIHFPAEKAVLVVDTIALRTLPYNGPDFDDCAVATMATRVKALNADYVIGGHGAVGSNADVDEQVAYMADLRRGVQSGIDAGRSLDQIKASLKLERYADWNLYGARLAGNIEAMHRLLRR